METPNFKKLRFIGTSLKDVRSFPEAARQELGEELLNVQYGAMPKDWKPMPTIGKGVLEIRIKCADGAYRAIYVTKFEEAIYVLHAFQKKTQKTSGHDIELAKSRLKILESER